MCISGFKKWRKGDVFLSDRLTIEEEGKKVTISSHDGIFNYDNARLPFSIYKSMPFLRSRLSLINDKKQYLTFVSPNEWLDPFEYYLYDESKFTDGKLFCFCASYSRAENEEAMWKMYCNGSDDLFNIWSLDLVKLLDALATISNKGGVTFYVTPIDYSLSKIDIVSIKKSNSYWDVVSMVNLLSRKRKAFKYEDEVRFFAHVTDPARLAESFALQRFNMKLNDKDNMARSILTKVLLQPYPPCKKGFLTQQEYSLLQEERNQEMKKFYNNLGVRTEQSRLYMV